jgi:hypothetical protein
MESCLLIVKHTALDDPGRPAAAAEQEAAKNQKIST